MHLVGLIIRIYHDARSSERQNHFSLPGCCLGSGYKILRSVFSIYLKDDEEVNRTWENIKGNIQTSAKESPGLHELKQHKPSFDEECLGFLDRRKRDEMQWLQLQDPSQNNVDNLNNVRREVSRHFGNKKEGISES